MKKSLIVLLVFVLALSVTSSAVQPTYSYSAQKNFIPRDLGKVYLGMPFRDLADEMVLIKAEVNSIRFDWLELTIPVDGKDVESVRMRIHGLSQEEKAMMIVSETVSGGNDDYEEDIDRLVISKIPADHGFVYSMYVTFKSDFDLRKYVSKTFGPGEDRKADDEFHFYDTQWTKNTSDGLDWLIRSFHIGEARQLQLLGRIPETEWGID